MNTAFDGRVHWIAERFDKALKQIRASLAEAELDLVAEWDLTSDAGKEAVSARVLLVDCPLLAFEALALDRAAGVFFPAHLLVEESGEQTRVVLAVAAGLANARLPAGAAGPIDRLHCRVALAVESAAGRTAARKQR